MMREDDQDRWSVTHTAACGGRLGLIVVQGWPPPAPSAPSRTRETGTSSELDRSPSGGADVCRRCGSCAIAVVQPFPPLAHPRDAPGWEWQEPGRLSFWRRTAVLLIRVVSWHLSFFAPSPSVALQ